MEVANGYLLINVTWTVSFSDVASFLAQEKERESGRERKRDILCTDAQITVVLIGCSRAGFSRVILALFQFQAACNNPVRIMCMKSYTTSVRSLGFDTDFYLLSYDRSAKFFIIIIFLRYGIILNYHNLLFI